MAPPVLPLVPLLAPPAPLEVADVAVVVVVDPNAPAACVLGPLVVVPVTGLVVAVVAPAVVAFTVDGPAPDAGPAAFTAFTASSS